VSAVDTKNSQKYLVEFHCHTFRSFDGFTTDRQLLEVCRAKNIKAIAITEHDLACQLDMDFFAAQGIQIIPGCEFTTDLGAHIIGLFIEKTLPAGSSREKIFEFVKNEDGLLLLPHPWKPGSGYFNFYDEDEYLHNVDLLELYNGGWESAEFNSLLIDLAKRFGIKLVGASDSHKAWQIGYYLSAYDGHSSSTLKQVIQNNQPEIWVDAALKKPPRSLNRLQENLLYQALIRCVPAAIKHGLKKMAYWKKSKSYVPTSSACVCLYKP